MSMMRSDELQIRLVPVLREHGIIASTVHTSGPLDSSSRSSVFALMIDHKYYVLKFYLIHANFVRDLRNYRRLPNPPPVLMALTSDQNPFALDLIITAVPQGTSMSSIDLTDTVAYRLGRYLIDLHRVRRSRLVSVAGLHRAVDDTAYGAPGAAGPKKTAVKRTISSMHKFLDSHGEIMRVRPSLLHNDVWWDNIIITQNGVYLVDWEWMKVGDYAEDLAHARIMLIHRPAHDPTRQFWDGEPDEKKANHFFKLIQDQYIREFGDRTLKDRLRFYMALATLRRLSDHAAGVFDLTESKEYWANNLSSFWHNGLK
jgi:aminoglycoside phosphotransferase (APT) family kinase protein